MGKGVNGRWGRKQEEGREGKLWFIYKINEQILIKNTLFKKMLDMDKRNSNILQSVYVSLSVKCAWWHNALKSLALFLSFVSGLPDDSFTSKTVSIFPHGSNDERGRVKCLQYI